MSERILRVINDVTAYGVHVQIVETAYEFGTHYVLLTNGMPGFHSTDYNRVYNYMQSIINP